MTNEEPSREEVALHVNGHLLAVADEEKFQKFEPALRGVALADSPVLIRAKDEYCGDLVQRLHKLGRRNRQPVHQCRHPEQAERLFGIMSASEDEDTDVLGTWALHRIDAWPREMQLTLRRVVEQLHQNSLHGRLRHERIPRVLVLQSTTDSSANLEPELVTRVSYFNVEARPAKKKDTKS